MNNYRPIIDQTSPPAENTGPTRHYDRNLHHPGRIRSRKKPHLAWEEADRRSEGQYSLFVHEIAERFPTLTSMELKTAALIKAMNASWEIAEALGISEHTVENHRVNIRRKTGVPPGANLLTRLLCLKTH